MSANLFEENKTNEKDNPIIQIMNKPEDDNESNINNQEKQNSIFKSSMIMKIINILIDKISKLDIQAIKKENYLEILIIIKEVHYLEIKIIKQVVEYF